MYICVWLHPDKDRELIMFIERLSTMPYIRSKSDAVRTMLYRYLEFERTLAASKTLRKSYERARKHNLRNPQLAGDM